MNEKRMAQRIKWNAYPLYLKEWADNEAEINKEEEE